MNKKRKKLKMPLRCFLNRWLFGVKPSFFNMCTLGLKSKAGKCGNCKHYIPNIASKGLVEGLEKGAAMAQEAAKTFEKLNFVIKSNHDFYNGLESGHGKIDEKGKITHE